MKKKNYRQLPNYVIKRITRPRRPKIPKPLPRLKVFKPVPFPRTEMPIYLSRIENNTIEDDTIGDNIKPSKTEKENEVIKDRIIQDIRALFESKSVRVGNFYNNNYIEYESNDDKNKTPSIIEYLDKIRSYLKDITNNPKKSDTWEIQLMIAINSMSKSTEEEYVIH